LASLRVPSGIISVMFPQVTERVRGVGVTSYKVDSVVFTEDHT
jgi:hypothetical protein